MVASGNVGLAWGLVVAAGLSTTLGATVVFCTSLAQPRILAVSLGFAAGVMLYISFAEIFSRKSIDGFTAVGLSSDEAFRYSTLCFFGGMGIIAVLDRAVHIITSLTSRRSRAAALAGLTTASTTSLLHSTDTHHSKGCLPLWQCRAAKGAQGPLVPPQQQRLQQQQQEYGGSSRDCLQQQQQGEPRDGGDKGDMESGGGCNSAHSLGAEPLAAMVADVHVPQDALKAATVQEQAAQSGSTSRQPPAVVEIMKSDHHNWALQKMGLLTATAIFIHNFPEGLATFVGSLADTKIGVGIAVAIAMHNIPEGICVAMPIYYATGSKSKGFVWALLSGISEPLGALLGYLVLPGSSDLAFAIVFGIVAGMMVYISVKELIPTALNYDHGDKVVTSAVVAGMAVMAGSLLLFTL